MNRKVGKYLSLSLMAVVAIFIVLVSYAVVWSEIKAYTVKSK